MKSKRDQQLRRKIKKAAANDSAYTGVNLTAPRFVIEKLNWLNKQLRRAEESGDMVKQNLIMEEIAKYEEIAKLSKGA